MDKNDTPRGFSGIADLISTVDDKKSTPKPPDTEFSGHSTPTDPQRDGLSGDWIFICKDNDNSSVYIDLNSVPKEEPSIIYINISIVPNKASSTYREAVEFLKSRGRNDSLHHMEQTWKVVVTSPVGKSKHFSVVKSVFKDERNQVLYELYVDPEWKPVLSGYISRAIYQKMIDIWTHGKDKFRNLPPDNQREPREVEETISNKSGFSTIADLASDVENVSQQQSCEPSSHVRTQEKSAQEIESESQDRRQIPVSGKSSARSWTIGIICFAIFIIVIAVSSMNNKPSESSVNINSPSNAPEASVPPPNSRPAMPERDESVTLGRYSCSRYHHNIAQGLKPTSDERQRIQSLKSRLSMESADLRSLKDDIQSLDRSSSSAVEYYNIRVQEFNSRLSNYRMEAADLRRTIDAYNDKISNYNSYLSTNCRQR